MRWIYGEQKSRIARLFAVALSLLFFHFFPYLVFTSYMSWEGFFSYDMFKDGVSGIIAYYWWAEVILIVGSFYIAGSIYFVVENKNKPGGRSLFRQPLFWAFLFVALAILIAILLSHWERHDGFNKGHIIALCIVAVWIVFHISLLLHSDGKPILLSLIFGATSLSFLAVINPGVLAFPYHLALQFFGNGGGIAASVHLAKGNKVVEGSLVLASPENVYMNMGENNQIVIISRRDIAELYISHLSGFGHKRIVVEEQRP